MKAQNYTRSYADFIIKTLMANNIQDYFVSPGMRNSPLVFALENNKANIYDGIDERAHAYRALGRVKTSYQPVCLICTSGTALANYLPAIIEAYKTDINLIVLSADRPPHLVSGNANQTIIQNNIYGHYQAISLNHFCQNVQKSFDELENKLEKLIDSQSNPGVSHLNLAFDEPLDQTTNEINFIQLEPKIYKTIIDKTLLHNDYHYEGRILIVIGDHHENRDEIYKSIKDEDAFIYPDITSGLKYHAFKNQIPSFDHPEVFEYFSKNKPNIIIHLGGRLTSKKYYQFLNENESIQLISVTSSPHKHDPSQTVDQTIHSKIINYLKNCSFKADTDRAWSNFYQTLINKKSKIVDNANLSYPSISKTVIDFLKSHHRLVIGNSTYIRSFDYYGSLTNFKEFKILTNRGASGIEGLLATAQGALLEKDPVVLMIGDVSLVHDLNSLIHWRDYNTPMLIICANNNGGGIFDLLPIHQDEKVMKHILTPPNFNLKSACEMVNFPYKEIKDKDNLINEINNWNEKPQSLFLDIVFSREDNLKTYDQLRTMNL